MTQLLQQYTTALLDFFEERSGSFMLLLAEDNTILQANQAMARSAGFPTKACRGMEVCDLLGQEIMELLEVEGEQETQGSYLLNLGSSTYLADCKLLFFQDGRKLLICEQIMLTENKLMEQMSRLNNEMTNMARELQRKNRELQKAMSEIKVLKDLLPICMYCKKIRDDNGYWNQLEAYISKYANTQFSHSICEECLEKYYPDLDLSDETD